MTCYEMQSCLEEIKNSFDVLNEYVQEKMGECDLDDIKKYQGDVFMATKKPSFYTRCFKSIFELLECADIVVKAQLEVVNKEVEEEEQAQRELEEEEDAFDEGYELGILDDPRINSVSNF